MSRCRKRLINGRCARFRINNLTPLSRQYRNYEKSLKRQRAARTRFLEVFRRGGAAAGLPTPSAAPPRSPAAGASQKNHWLRSASAPCLPLLRPQTRRRAAATLLRAARRRLRRAAPAGCACEVCRRPNTVVNEWARTADVELIRELTKSRAIPAPWCRPTAARRARAGTTDSRRNWV